MIFGVEQGVWIVAFGVVIFNALVCFFINAAAAKRAYKRGYQAAQITNEALALGRLMEKHRETYEIGKKAVDDLDL